jgi:hypothetical protein
MFRKLVPLRNAVHADLRVQRLKRYDFARGEIMAPIVVDELADVAREYPIMFPKGMARPVALMGVEKGNNAYVAADGQWRASYVPAHIRHYPFALAKLPDAQAGGEGREANSVSMAVMIDVESDAVGTAAGQPVFSDGKLTPAIKSVVDMMQRLAQREGVTALLVSAMDEAGVLVERAIRIKSASGEEKRVTGLRVVDEKALNALDEAAFNKLRKSGALPLVYAALLSWANFRQGPIGKSYPVPTAPDLGQETIQFN